MFANVKINIILTYTLPKKSPISTQHVNNAFLKFELSSEHPHTYNNSNFFLMIFQFTDLSQTNSLYYC